MSGCPKISDLVSFFKFFSCQVVNRTVRYIQPDYRSRIMDSDKGFIRADVLKEAWLQKKQLTGGFGLGILLDLF